MRPRRTAYGRGACRFTPISRDQRIRILRRAEAIERATKARGKQAGALGQSGLRVLRCLLFDFANTATGRCDPGYRAICRATGFCRQTVAGALARLEAMGLVEIVRRMARAGRRAVQATNAYLFAGADAAAPVQAVLPFRSEPPEHKNQKGAIPMPTLPAAIPGHLWEALQRLGASLGRRMPA
jgi:DNA-binding MarR family transcriptional regulator